MELPALLIVIAVASILQGITGFGSALIAAPLALLVTDKVTTVIFLTFVSLAINAFLFKTVRESVDRSLLALLFGASLAGLPLGIAVLRVVDTQELRVVAGTLSVFFAVFLYFRIMTVSRSRWLVALVGVVAGILHTSISLSGPPVVLLLMGVRREKDDMRKMLAAFFFLMSVVSVALFAVTGTLTAKGALFGLYGIPAALAGGYIGAKAARFLSARQFTALVFLLVCVTGAVAVYSGLRP
jgi:hypothetical protein